MYFDNAATTRVLPEVFEEMRPYFCESYGNPSSIHDLGPAADKAEQARRVFDALREFDHETVTEIYAQCPDTAGLGLAVANRLKKAAGFHVIEV